MNRDIVVAGMALFAMFFGAGNLIFPPYLGMMGGSSWVVGFLCFVLVDVVLSCVGIYAMIHGGGSIGAMEGAVGKKAGFLLNTAAILCTGVLIAPPRTAATTYEMAIVPLTDRIGLVPFSLAFFAVVLALTIRPTKVVDIIGKVLTPVLVLGIFVLIVAGIVNPVGPVASAAQMEEGGAGHIAMEGLVAGYQAMDILSVSGFAIVVGNDLYKRGFEGKKDQLRAAALSSLVAAALLFLIYGGLTYLGATASDGFGHGMNQAQLIVAITGQLLGSSGVFLLGVVVGCACLTTAVGLFGATASYFEEVTGGRMAYRTNILLLTVIGFAICNLGLEAIISAAAPVLSILCPPFMVTVILLMFREKIKERRVYQGAALAGLAIGLWMTFG